MEEKMNKWKKRLSHPKITRFKVVNHHYGRRHHSCRPCAEDINIGVGESGKWRKY